MKAIISSHKIRTLSLLLAAVMLFTCVPLNINVIAQGDDPPTEISYAKLFSRVFDDAVSVPFAFSYLPTEDGRYTVTIEHYPEAVEHSDYISMTICTDDTAPLGTYDGFTIVSGVQYHVVVTYHFEWFIKDYLVNISVVPGDMPGDPDDITSLDYYVVDAFETLTAPVSDIVLPDIELQPMIISEDTSKRGEYEKHFLCDDGSFIAVSYPEPVHKQIDGEWVDNELSYIEEDDRFVFFIGDSVVSLAKTTGIAAGGGLLQISKGEHDLQWTAAVPEGATTLYRVSAPI